MPTHIIAHANNVHGKVHEHEDGKWSFTVWAGDDYTQGYKFAIPNPSVGIDLFMLLKPLEVSKEYYAPDERRPPILESTHVPGNPDDNFNGIAADPTWKDSEHTNYKQYFVRVAARWPHGQFGRAIRFILENYLRDPGMVPPVDPANPRSDPRIYSPGGDTWANRFKTEVAAHQDTLRRTSEEAEQIRIERDEARLQLDEALVKLDSHVRTIRALAVYREFFDVIKTLTKND